MIKHVLLAIAVITALSAAQPLAQELRDSTDEVKALLGYSPHEMIEKTARRKIAARDRLLKREKLLADRPATNWQEYDVTYYDIHWRPVYETESIFGEVGIYCRPAVASLDSVIVDLSSALTVDSVYNASGLLTFVHSDDLLKVYLDRPYALGEVAGLVVVYHGQPEPGTDYPGGLEFYTHNGAPAVDMLSEPYLSRLWWPCNDIPADKADSIDVRIIVDTGMTATSNGVLVSDADNADGTHTVHWRHRHPISTYLICMAVADYVSWDDYYVYGQGDSLPIINYTFPDIFEPSYELLSLTPTVMSVFSGLFGQYPFIDEKYGHTATRISGMEHQTNTFMEIDTAQHHTLTRTVIHELAHQWWGDMITCRDWHNAWLNEGFATYSEALYAEATLGETALRLYMLDIEVYNWYSCYCEDTIINIFSGAYNRGAWALHMLRHIVGNSAFFDILHTYRDTYLYGTAVTDDFKAICEAVSGQDLDYFFDEWVYGGWYPQYYYSFTKRHRDDGKWNLYLFIEQYQANGADVYVMPVDLRVYFGIEDTIMTVVNVLRKQNFALSTDLEPTNVEFDPNNWILDEHSRTTYTIHIITDSLKNGRQGEPYEDSIIAVSIYGHENLEIVSGELPSGWSFDGSSGTIFGLSYDTGSFTFLVRATDAIAPSFVDSISYTVNLASGDFPPGDANADGDVNIGDAVYLVNYVFKGGSPPLILNCADANADCTINVADAVYLVNFIFKGGPEPQTGCVE